MKQTIEQRVTALEQARARLKPRELATYENYLFIAELCGAMDNDSGVELWTQKEFDSMTWATPEEQQEQIFKNIIR